MEELKIGPREAAGGGVEAGGGGRGVGAGGGLGPGPGGLGAGGPAGGARDIIGGMRLRKTRSSDSTSAGGGDPDRSFESSGGNSPDGLKSRSDTSDTTQSRLSRRSSARVGARDSAQQLFSSLPDVTKEAITTFQLIPDCLYGSKNLGSTDNDALDCECREDWCGGVNRACGEDDNCINRATKMECSAGFSSNCARGCQNQRFQRKQVADVSVIHTDKKGFGLRANQDLHPGDFVWEYIGEVINEPTFRRRMLQYDQEGIRHFYFMSLSRNEFVDATKKGSLGRFCNHSCNPNCFVDKWVVGEKLRMGIFAKRPIRAGEELVFNYNVDRYGAEAQPCYCAEPNCSGYIGGKTQTTGPATQLPLATIEALGIAGAGSDDDAGARRPARRKRPEEGPDGPEDDGDGDAAAASDEAYVSRIQARGLDEEGARKVMASLAQCRERWIASKLLERIQRTDREKILLYVMHMHAYRILRTTLTTFTGDNNLILQVLDILYKFPRITRNKIQDSNIEPQIKALAASGDPQIAAEAARLLAEWAKLEIAYRIRRRRPGPDDGTGAGASPLVSTLDERRSLTNNNPAADRDSDPAAASKTASPVLDAPRGPRGALSQRNPSFHGHMVGPNGGGGASFGRGGGGSGRRNNLPDGWFQARDKLGKFYYYTKRGDTTWHRPTQPVPEDRAGPPKAPPKCVQEELLYQSIIDEVTREVPRKRTAATPTSGSGSAGPSAGSVPSRRQTETPQFEDRAVVDARRDRWRNLPVEKQMRLYENTLVPHVTSVMSKYREKIPKDELKKLGRDAAKTLVASDYKHGRVEDPTAAVSDRMQKKIKAFLREYFDRAVIKWETRQREREKQPEQGQEKQREQGQQQEQNQPQPQTLQDEVAAGDTPELTCVLDNPVKSEEDLDVAMSEGYGVSPIVSDGCPEEELLRKRKREDRPEDDDVSLSLSPPADVPEPKRHKEEDAMPHTPPPPPPPPPLPSAGTTPAKTPLSEEQQQQQQLALREQEEALMRENEEAQRLEDEAALGRIGQQGHAAAAATIINRGRYDGCLQPDEALRGCMPAGLNLQTGKGTDSQEVADATAPSSSSSSSSAQKRKVLMGH